MTMTKTTEAHGFSLLEPKRSEVPAQAGIQSAGFSLLELSIVLVIIGLIAGGITVGADMVRAAELRSVMTQYSQIQTAVMTFKDKYMALPGDMKNATAFWGAAHATPATCTTTVGTGTQTCNGDGDGVIGYLPDATEKYEMFRFWQHLANAGLIEGQFTGVTGPASAHNSVIGINSPAGKITAAGWSVSNLATYAGDGAWFAGQYDNHLIFGAQHISEYTENPVLKPEEAWSIDIKLDDGKPAKGSVLVIWHGQCTTASGATDTTADYDLTANSLECALVFARQF